MLDWHVKEIQQPKGCVHLKKQIGPHTGRLSLSGSNVIREMVNNTVLLWCSYSGPDWYTVRMGKICLCVSVYVCVQVEWNVLEMPLYFTFIEIWLYTDSQSPSSQKPSVLNLQHKNKHQTSTVAGIMYDAQHETAYYRTLWKSQLLANYFSGPPMSSLLVLPVFILTDSV